MDIDIPIGMTAEEYLELLESQEKDIRKDLDALRAWMGTQQESPE